MTLKLIWMTDLHLRAQGDPGAAVNEARLRACIDHAHLHHADAQLCVVTGDLADTGEMAEYRDLERFGLGRWNDLRVLPGNHDRADVLAQSLTGKDRHWPESMSVAGFRLVLLDTSVAGSDRGRVGGDVLKWLDAQCRECAEPILLFMHHQPGPTFVPSTDTIGLEDASAFADLLARQRGRIAHIFFGHCHMPISGSLAGVGFTGLPATAHQQYPNFADETFVTDWMAPPYYGVIFADEHTIATHIVRPGRLAERE